MASPQKTVVFDVVGLCRDLISEEHTPFLYKYLAKTDVVAKDIEPAFPALTCPAQSTYMSGTGPSTHGITANGFYDRSYCEVKNWHQSAKLVKTPRIWDALKAKHPDATVFVNGLWHGMHDPNIDFFINVRPQYLQNGGKVADVYTHPAGLREELQGSLGTFPLHRFWGPGTSIESSQWTAAACKQVDREHDPTLTLVYLPHLDYGLQKYGPPVSRSGPSEDDKIHGSKVGGSPDDAEGTVVNDLKEIDKVVEGLVAYYESDEVGAKVVILSEYAITRVERPVYLNRVLREEGLVQVRTENGGETLDCGECRAFALCDHQVAHIHVRHPSDVPRVRRILMNTPGVEKVLDSAELDAHYRDAASDRSGGIESRTRVGEGRRAADSRAAHHVERSGELVAVSDSSSWFAYYYWTDDSKAPDFARCVAIHRKPGYDPAEMFFRYPGIRGFAWLIFKLFLTYGLKLRTIVDATPLRCDGIRGSHGRLPEGDHDPRPLITFRAKSTPATAADAVDVPTGENAATEGGEHVAGGVAGDRIESLGLEACLAKGCNVVAEDVYEILWRILNGEI